MRYSSAVLVLATAFVSTVVAGPVQHMHGHQHVHAKKCVLLPLLHVAFMGISY
jgi:hypothetical protein